MLVFPARWRMIMRDAAAAAAAPAVALKQLHWLDSGSAQRKHIYFNYAHVQLA